MVNHDPALLFDKLGRVKRFKLEHAKITEKAIGCCGGGSSLTEHESNL